MRNAIRHGVVAAIGSLLLGIAAPAWGQAQTGAVAPDAALEAPEDWSTWVATLEESAQKVRSLRKIHAALEADVSRMRSRRYPRGEERERLLAAYGRAQSQLAEAEANHPALLEQARQAGVPLGLLQDFEEIPAAGS